MNPFFEPCCGLLTPLACRGGWVGLQHSSMRSHFGAVGASIVHRRYVANAGVRGVAGGSNPWLGLTECRTGGHPGK